MFTKNEFFQTKSRINSFKKDYGGNVIVKSDNNELQSAQDDFIFFNGEEAIQNRFSTTPEKTWKEEMKAGKLHFEPPGTQKGLKVFKDEEKEGELPSEVQQQQNSEELPKKPKKKRFCCCF